MVRAFLPRMLEMDKGSVVSLCSIAGHAGAPHMVPYSASKFAVKGRDVETINSKVERASLFCVNLVTIRYLGKTFLSSFSAPTHRWTWSRSYFKITTANWSFLPQMKGYITRNLKKIKIVAAI